MNENAQKMTCFFKKAVAAQSNLKIDFKNAKYRTILKSDFLKGKLNPKSTKKIFKKLTKNKSNQINVIICPKVLKTKFDNQAKTNNRDELTGLYFIPAILNKDGQLKFDQENKKIPWIPREFLQPIIEADLAIGKSESADEFLSQNVNKIDRIQTWSDYSSFFKKYFEYVNGSEFKGNKILAAEEVYELEDEVYLFVDNTINATYSIKELYNDIIKRDESLLLYENFLSQETAKTGKLVENELSQMKDHCGQMGGEFPLSKSQREAVNHVNSMKKGEILAVNGPPGTGKTTLLQSIVADLFVKRALKKEKAPLIVATSTNNQAVTNIISSFKSLETTSDTSFEQRWVCGVDSFATYFPSNTKIEMAEKKNYQYTNIKGEYFVESVDNSKNIKKSKDKFLDNFNNFFDCNKNNLQSCQNRLHKELRTLNRNKNKLLSLVAAIRNYLSEVKCVKESNINDALENLNRKIAKERKNSDHILNRSQEWEIFYENLPLLYKLLKFIPYFKRKIKTKFGFFIKEKEINFLNTEMTLDQILEKYNLFYQKILKQISNFKEKKDKLMTYKKEYDEILEKLLEHNVDLTDKEGIYDLDLDNINALIDQTTRYMEFWLAVHYYEARWLRGEDELSENQKGCTYENVLDKFYNRLAFISPCLVMTFYKFPSQFKAYIDPHYRHMFNKIDLLIVDEAGQVSPEIAAPSFALAKKALVVGDVHQLQPVWSINRVLDKTFALTSKAIENENDYDKLVKFGLNTSSSSVMLAASRSCIYKKYGMDGLFLTEHRRCFDEIISYCNELVYNGNLEPMRGSGKQNKDLVLVDWPHMGHKQIESQTSAKLGTSRANKKEAGAIVNWINNNYDLIKKLYPQENEEDLIGIISPFRAQTNLIEKQLKKMNLTQIETGTVHTFQGAERKIIIFSTVYGSQEKSSFIDSNKNLMNVAVSRSKDYFFVFGEINCLSDSKSSASGLLKNYLKPIN
ncbi:superfamily I DNA and/or RNA helicase [Halanaerobium saccharolyticum]|uniref:Superfamily I DNA and/or RNA helicase n=1 Tax=Halanaerobium saccharolyticum TaxID=43595 RepID=A0A4R7Z3G2_9FIRM|nr:AAA domain-containing protein [Halanaerobium saccharolyticum]RAK12612.1 superfamily I DNA and/or RNA helicase [Halanaerobium saccharolyticum]TDW05476.1 superfamily I DNA and/or RNA helicase [Halanaerobium saccharolyticum]TDX62991.1 superfamily I DNA and/or RNA helicase [Halanaerobium saccharolyticum]